jgi:phage host-nuclease inhibitor protein Gam
MEPLNDESTNPEVPIESLETPLEIPPDILEDLMEDGEIEDVDDSKPWKMDTPERAAWGLRKLAYWQSRIDEVDRIAASEIERIRIWQDMTNANFRRSVEYFEGQLESYHRVEFSKDEKKKTLTFPAGVLKRTEGSYSVGVEDPDAFLEWAVKNADTLVRVPDPKPEVNKQEITKAIKSKTLVERNGVVYQDGEPVPGITYKKKEPTFKVIPAKAKVEDEG